MGFLLFFPVHGVFITINKTDAVVSCRTREPLRPLNPRGAGAAPLPAPRHYPIQPEGLYIGGLYSLSDHLKLKFESDISGFFCVVLVVIQRQKSPISMMRIIPWLSIYRLLLFLLISGGFMSQFQKNPFYFGNTVVFTLLVLLSWGQATPRDEVIVKSISKRGAKCCSQLLDG